MEKLKKDEFFELLLLNDEIKLKNFINSEGKSPKPICPIMFESEDTKDNDSRN